MEITIRGYLGRLPTILPRAMVATYFRLFFLGRIGNVFGSRMPTGAPRKQPGDDEAGLERLVAGIALVKNADAPHWTRLHLFHCEHHFSFLIPSSGYEHETNRGESV